MSDRRSVGFCACREIDLAIVRDGGADRGDAAGRGAGDLAGGYSPGQPGPAGAIPDLYAAAGPRLCPPNGLGAA